MNAQRRRPAPKDVREVVKRARDGLTRALELSSDDSWLLLHDEADQLRVRADELHAIARRERQAYLDERAAAMDLSAEGQE